MKPLRSTPQPAGLVNPKSSLKIGFVLDDSLDRTGGVQEYILTLGQWLGSQGHEVHYIVSTTNRTDLKHMHSLSRNIPMRFNGNYLRIPLPASRRAIQRFLGQAELDVLHIQVPYSPFFGGIVINAANARTAVIGTFHIAPKSELVYIASRLLAVLCHYSLKRFDKVVSVSTVAQKLAAEAFHLQTIVIPNVVSLQKFREAKSFPNMKTASRLNILFLGKLVPRKGCQELLEAVRLMHQTQPELQFGVTICGSGPLAEPLKQFVHKHELDAFVVYTGFVSENDKPRYYASADIVVFPSMAGESFGIVLLEAMASGKAAVIAGDNPGYRTLLGDCPEEVLVDPKNAAALAQKLQLLIGDAKLRSRIIQWQSQRVRDFDVRQIGPKLLTIYRSALQRRGNV